MGRAAGQAGIVAAILGCAAVLMAGVPGAFGATPVRAQPPPAQPAPAQPDPAAAQPGQPGSGQPENMDRARQARDYFMQGAERFRAHDYRGAIQFFTLAAGLVPSADLWFNIARSHQEIGELELAIEFYQRYLRDRVDPPDRAQVEATIAALQERAEAARQARRTQPTTGELSINASVDGSSVAVDTRDLGRSPLAAPMAMQPGVHRLTVRSDGFVPFQSDVRVSAGVPTAAYADLVPETRYQAIRGSRIFTWIAGGLTVVALGASAYFAIDAAGYDLDTPEAYMANFQNARDAAALSDAMLGTAFVLGVVTVALYFIEGRSIGTERITTEAPPRTSLRATAEAGLAAPAPAATPPAAPPQTTPPSQ